MQAVQAEPALIRSSSRPSLNKKKTSRKNSSMYKLKWQGFVQLWGAIGVPLMVRIKVSD